MKRESVQPTATPPKPRQPNAKLRLAFTDSEALLIGHVALMRRLNHDDPAVLKSMLLALCREQIDAAYSPNGDQLGAASRAMNDQTMKPE